LLRQPIKSPKCIHVKEDTTKISSKPANKGVEKYENCIEMKDSCRNSCKCDIIGCIFATNNTRHASRKISAPRRVFDFYREALS